LNINRAASYLCVGFLLITSASIAWSGQKKAKSSKRLRAPVITDVHHRAPPAVHARQNLLGLHFSRGCLPAPAAALPVLVERLQLSTEDLATSLI
jgi:hypothetical protein